MKYFQTLMKKGPLVLPVVLIFIGIFCGYILSRIFYSFLPDVIFNWNQSYLDGMLNTKVKGTELFRYTLWNNIKEMIIYFMLCLTVLGLPYYTYCILKKSFQVSFLITTFLYMYGPKGIFLAFCHYFPQVLIYIPAACLCLKYGLELYKDVQSGRLKPSLHNNMMLKRYGKSLMLIIGLLLAGAFAEALIGKILWLWAVEMMQK